MLLDRLNNFEENYNELTKVAKCFYEKQNNNILLANDYSFLIEKLISFITDIYIGEEQKICSNELADFIITNDKILFFTKPHNKKEVFLKLESFVSLILKRK